MANDAGGVSWDELVPNLTTERRLGQREIRAVRVGIRVRLQKEHDTPAGSSVGGEHKQGSAKAYFDSSTPIFRPDGVTSLNSADNGRLFINTTSGYVLQVYDDATGFENVSGTQVATGNFTGAALTAGEQTCAAGFVADVVHLITSDGFAWTVPLKDEADPGPGGIYQSTAVNTVRVRIRRSGTDVLISLTSSTLTLSGTFQWMAIKY